jgi:DNA-binding MarR family transcriptional regulator
VEAKITNYFNTLKKFSQILLNRLMESPSVNKSDLRLSQMKAITAFTEDCSYTMKELASNGMIKLPNMTTMVDSLIKEGFAERKKDEQDRRKVFVQLTPKGKKIRKDFLKGRRMTAMSIFSDLSVEDKNDLLNCLDRVCNILEKSINIEDEPKSRKAL